MKGLHMTKKKELNMTEGSVIKPLILFILPLIGSSIFQQLYNTADYWFVGNYLGRPAAAAVGASSSLITCTIGLFTGISLGTNVITAQYIGAKKKEEANRMPHVYTKTSLIRRMGNLYLLDLLLPRTKIQHPSHKSKMLSRKMTTIVLFLMHSARTISAKTVKTRSVSLKLMEQSVLLT